MSLYKDFEKLKKISYGARGNSKIEKIENRIYQRLKIFFGGGGVAEHYNTRIKEFIYIYNIINIINNNNNKKIILILDVRGTAWVRDLMRLTGFSSHTVLKAIDLMSMYGIISPISKDSMDAQANRGIRKIKHQKYMTYYTLSENFLSIYPYIKEIFSTDNAQTLHELAERSRHEREVIIEHFKREQAEKEHRDREERELKEKEDIVDMMRAQPELFEDKKNKKKDVVIYD